MGQKICLDTDVVIAILNGEERVNNIFSILGNYEVFISTITLFELLLRKTNLDKIQEFRNNVNILDFNETAVHKASHIFKALKESGNLVDLRDIFVASISIVDNCMLITFNKKHFSRITEFGLILFE